VRETDLQVQLLALGLGTETHANQVQLALEALADAADHVGHQCAHRAAQRIGFGRFVDRHEAQLAGFVLDGDKLVRRTHQRTERALDADRLSGDGHIHALREVDRHFSNAGHCSYSFA
jgi:hypothetical protein